MDQRYHMWYVNHDLITKAQNTITIINYLDIS